MPNSKFVRVTNLDKELSDKFDNFYPNVRRSFLERCLTLAIRDKNFFDKAYFNEIFIEIK